MEPGIYNWRGPAGGRAEEESLLKSNFHSIVGREKVDWSKNA